jgi:uncharacterized protein YprB with RNaseH-like and TPR domain
MKVSVAVTYSTARGDYKIYTESEMHHLVDELTRADLVVGFNHIGFDYGVLQAYTIFDLVEQTQNLDMLVEVEKILGHRVKLDSIASASLGQGKTADGLDALKWWQEHKRTGNFEPLIKIAEYCAYDVKVTKAVHEYGIQHGFVRFEDRTGNIQECKTSW